MNWLSENGGTLLVGLILALAVGLIIRVFVRDKRQGKSSCGHGCAGCPMCGACHHGGRQA